MRTFFIPAGVVFVVAIIILWGVLFSYKDSFRFDLRYALELFGAPPDVKNMLFITEDTQGKRGISSIKYGGVYTTSFGDWSVLQIARAENMTLGLLQDVQSGVVEVFLIEGKHITPLTEDGVRKSGITISSDGTRFAYSTEGPVFPGVPEENAYDVRRYTTHIIEGLDEETSALPGNHPYFLEGDLLLVLNERGFEVYDLGTGAGNATLDDLAFLAVEPPLYSHDGGFIVQNPVTDEFLLMKFASYDPVFPVLLSVFPAEEGVLFALKDKNLYRSVSSEGVFTLARLDGQADVVQGIEVLSLPTSVLKPLAIIP